MTSSNPASPSSTPSAEQLAAARAARWHQNAEPLLTIETMRDWIVANGLVLYTPRAQQLPSPAPSFVEATLGVANTEPTLTDMEQARGILSRLVAEGVVVPLNLLGVTGGNGTDVPDFVVSAQVFSYVFTLRGNKAWKQVPSTSGAVKVSPLALAAYEILTAKISMSAYELTSQLGKEVTEVAVLRALTELWGQLRVIPVPQQDGSATLWELASTRFTKQIKSGANAGQPTALSALISLYLGQSLMATEDEIETFLSPLAARSRLRDVIHALLSARQLDAVVVEGKTLLHVAGDLPVFAGIAKPEQAEPVSAEVDGDGERIRKFTPKPGSKIGTGLRSKPGFGGKPAYGSKPSFGRKPGFGGASDGRERRPFNRDAKPFGKPTYNKPWEEDKAARQASPSFDGGVAASGEGSEGARPAFTPRPSRPGFGGKPSFGSKPGFGGKPRFEGRREGFSPRPSLGGDRPARPFTPRPFSSEGGEAGPRKTFSKPGTFGRKREGFGAPSGEGRPPRREFGGGSDRPAGGGFKKPFGGPRPDRAGFSDRPSFGSKPGFSRDRGEQGGGDEAPRKVFRKFDAPRGPKPFGSKPFGSKPFGGKPAGDRPSRPFDANRPPRPPFGGDRSDRPARSFGDRPARPFGDRPTRSFGDRPARPFGGDRSGSSDRPRPEGRPSFGAKPGGFGGKKPFGKSSGSGGFSKPGGTFAKFADGKKPFRKPGPGKPSFGGKSGGGFKPSRRREDGK
ncbi:hypothetical protein FTO74_15595 [Granulicella sp. WH15]|uniref:DNA glycosylase AlkZ-like family protein n=1 Tax=Granulicella sp. WH15 TaxID=2602070 RepID=UPI0013676D56|nr:crosslink repair DNA glycosylase YcaQ family protein [Granulicella sp. WH15]QHN04625.1 hypothetical protein FTO74_15595 [Granulicella sp. WH15]